MPITEYICGKCNNRYDVLTGMTDSDDPIECPKCKSTENQNFVPSSTGRPIIK